LITPIISHWLHIIYFTVMAPNIYFWKKYWEIFQNNSFCRENDSNFSILHLRTRFTFLIQFIYRMKKFAQMTRPLFPIAHSPQYPPIPKQQVRNVKLQILQWPLFTQSSSTLSDKIILWVHFIKLSFWTNLFEFS